VDDWIDRLAAQLGEEPITPAEMGAILKMAREVAHGVERKLAPVSTYLAGVHAGRASAGGGTERIRALTEAVESALVLIPPASDQDDD
jgi:Domain of unknown function (DUF6457)